MKALTTMLRSMAIAVVAAACAAAGTQAQSARTAATVPIVVELFTSQGCNSCPPADAFLAELARRPGLLALSIHVDYWDYIGWKDPFAQRAFTERQRAYSQTMPQRYIYTPQLVLDGRLQEVGSERKAVERVLQRLRSEPIKRLAIRLAGGGDAVAIENPEGVSIPSDRPASVWLVTYDRLHSTKVTRGENAGKTLDNVNVVRRLDRIGSFAGDPLTVPLDLSHLESGQGCAVIVQTGAAGAVLGVLVLDGVPRF